MPFYEVIYETGAHSIAEYANDTEALSAVKAHHDKATAGELGGPSEHPAERIKRVLVYDSHPGDVGSTQSMSADVLYAEIGKIVSDSKDENGICSLPEVTAAIRDLSSSLVTESRPHESNFKAKETKELTLAWGGV